MKNYGIISAANLPLNMAGNQAPFNLVSLAQSALASSKALPVPNWAHTSGDGGDVVAPSSSDDVSAGFSPTYSTPREASAAYQSGLLKSDSKISSSHPKMRLAIRYLLEEEGTDIHLHGWPTDGEDLFLCWINQDGVPHHFRRMRPLRYVGGVNHSNLPTASQYRNATILVNENDLIETTFPGHAFVFCRKVEYGYNDTSVEGQDGHDPIVFYENNMTYFLRKVKKSDKEEDGFICEKYLVVGGYRPGPMSKVTEDEDENSRSEYSEMESVGGDGGHEIESEGDDGTLECRIEQSDDESDGDSCDEDYLVQLVTILCVSKDMNANSQLSQNEHQNTMAKHESETHDCSPPSKVLCCSSDCFQTVPFLRGLMYAKTRDTRAFVASGTDFFSDNPSSEDLALSISVCISRLDPTPLDTSMKFYDEVILGGWPCRIEPGCFPADMTLPSNGRNLLRMRFELDLMAASLSLPVKARAKLKNCTPIWINKSQSYGPKAAPVHARDACFHPGAGWLKRVGMSKKKCGGVEFFDAKHYLSDCDLWGPGGLILHELSHAWHSKFVKDGYNNKEIINVYKKAMKEGLYDSVRVRGPQGPMAKAYACQNQMEYFAELSVAFLGGLDEEEHNKWYPFNRSQLREHDPRAFAMLCRMWGLDIEEQC
ncbi:hypothetical protein ACHAXA_002280 [Cyclostephanos tholiformis]|uniref:Lysine-specific metallo-endopeptidase domain-containing protein n=1 Tax=Cyclostephanos tholiformis TaxID=382380 RepID=A0ABD3RDT9_9STRA